MKMKAIILAAGLGSRLRPMTDSKPKCLVKINGKPLLQYQLDAYKQAGIVDILIIVGYQGSKVEEYCKHIKGLNIKVIYNNDYEFTNNMYSLYLARDLLCHTSFILNNADLAITPGVVNQLVNSSFDDLIFVDTSQYNEESMKISIGKNGYVRDISKTISADVAMQRLFKSEKLLFKSLNIAPQPWIEVDDYNDVLLGYRKFSKFDSTIKDINNIFFDLDGTIYIGDELIAGADDLINYLLQEDKKIYFLTNNSSKSKKEYVKKLANFDINVHEDNIVLSTDSLIEYLNSQHVKKIYVLGTEACKQYLRDKNFDLDSAEPEYIIITYDTEINYSKLVEACRYINAGVDILATHGNKFCPSEIGPIPDAGSIIEMFRVATGKSPVKTFGKPNTSVLNTLIKNRKINLDDCLIVGDRIDTDIKMANDIGCKSLLVLSGESTLDMLNDTDTPPTYVLNSLAQW